MVFGRRYYVALLVLICTSSRRNNRFSVLIVAAYDNDYDYVNEVLEDDEMHYGEQRQQPDPAAEQVSAEEAARQSRKAEQERIERERADHIASDREKAFEKDLAKMNEDQKKKAMKQKKKDSRIVKSILKAARKDNHYGVLGIKNLNMRIPERRISIAGLKFTIPGITLKQTSTKDVKRAFRVRTKLVHPDKNRDGRATEAFIAVENAASVLSDEKSKAKYDDELRILKQEQRSKSKALVVSCLTSMQQIFRALLAVLGPLATPVLTITALII